MSKRIRVDTDVLKQYAKEIDLIASQTGKTGDRLYQSTYSLNDYGGQLPTKKTALTAQRDANIIRDDLAEDGEQLRILAGRFEVADNEIIGSLIPRPPYELPTPWFRDFLHPPRWGWDPNTPDGYVTRPGDNKFGPSQFINLEELFGDEKYYVDNSKEKSRGLCGELCAFHLAGIVDLKSAFQKIKDSGDDDLLRHLENDENLFPEDMQRLLKILGVKTGETQMIPQGTMLSPDTFKEILDADGKVAVLVNIDGNGKITDPNKQLGKGHWVTVEDMWVDSTGTQWVEVYNPYTNSYEAYRWDTFAASMQQPGVGNETAGYYIPILPEDDQNAEFIDIENNAQ